MLHLLVSNPLAGKSKKELQVSEIMRGCRVVNYYSFPFSTADLKVNLRPKPSVTVFKDLKWPKH